MLSPQNKMFCSFLLYSWSLACFQVLQFRHAGSRKSRSGDATLKLDDLATVLRGMDEERRNMQDPVAARIRSSPTAVQSGRGFLICWAHLARRMRTRAANFSASGLKHQDNDLIVIENAGAAAAFKRTFDARFASGQSIQP